MIAYLLLMMVGFKLGMGEMFTVVCAVCMVLRTLRMALKIMSEG